MTKPSPWGGEPERLEPCPFCGDEVEMRPLYTLGSPAPTAFRPKCRCGVVGRSARTEVEAVAAWNRRTPSQSLYPPDEGRTHWEGCWRERGHHNCAVAMIDDLRAQLAEFDAAPSQSREELEDCVVVELNDEPYCSCERASKAFTIVRDCGHFPDGLPRTPARIALGEREP